MYVHGVPKVPRDFKHLVLGDRSTKLAETSQIRLHWAAFFCVRGIFVWTLIAQLAF